MVTLQSVLKSWKAIREHTAVAVEDMPEEGMDFKPTPDMLSFRELARHILDASYALNGLLLAGETNFGTAEFREKMKPIAAQLPPTPDRQTLAAELRAALDRQLGEMAKQDESFGAREVARFDGSKGSTTEMVQALKEHELSHRSQLFVYLRLKGVVPATTRARLAKYKT